MGRDCYGRIRYDETPFWGMDLFLFFIIIYERANGNIFTCMGWLDMDYDGVHIGEGKFTLLSTTVPC